MKTKHGKWEEYEELKKEIASTSKTSKEYEDRINQLILRLDL